MSFSGRITADFGSRLVHSTAQPSRVGVLPINANGLSGSQNRGQPHLLAAYRVTFKIFFTTVRTVLRVRRSNIRCRYMTEPWNVDGLVVARAIAGDREVLDDILTALEGPLYRYISRLLTHRDTAEDALQESLFRI
jgi:hypothetical protein